ncbi:cupin domain-containing protein [Bacillus spongiae]|uniref:Cupin domain-containing protein n=1 Tax=Bacillus spongiae TaxID=2683610 RepID=A0ABU8HF81_9BACI
MDYQNQVINISEKLTKFNEHWSPKVIGEMNNYQFKLAKIIGEFVWHSHKETDEVFIIMEGEMKISFRDGEVSLKKGDMYVIPKGKEHRPFSEKECHVMIIEPKGVVNTGENEGELTAENDVWI